MRTHRTRSPVEAAGFIRSGGIVAFPTETVYGLGADALSVAAVGRIFEAKRRPQDNPLIVHVADVEQVEMLAAEVSSEASKLIRAFFPGPLTVVLKKNAAVPDVTTAGLDTVAIRCPAPELAHAFLSACETPVAAPSANVSGRPSPTTWEAVLQDLDGRIDCILEGGRTEHGLESTVVDCTGSAPIVLRPGAVSLEALREVAPATRLAVEADADIRRSPGMRYRHYAPHARVELVAHPSEIPEAGPAAAYIGMDPPPDAPRIVHVLVCETLSAYAQGLYDFFRTCDARGVTIIFAQRVAPIGLGLAIVDRLQRAAGGAVH